MNFELTRWNWPILNRDLLSALEDDGFHSFVFVGHFVIWMCVPWSDLLRVEPR